MVDLHVDARSTRISDLRDLLGRLTSPALTLAEAREVRARIATLLGGESTETSRVERHCVGAGG